MRGNAMKITSTVAAAVLMFVILMVGSSDAFGQLTQEGEASDDEHTNPRIVVDSAVSGEEHTNPRIVVDGEAPDDDDVDSEAPDDGD
jgi:hypothetical protein